MKSNNIDTSQLYSKLSAFDKNIVYPKISIVTPTYNQGSYIEETIKSVLSQEYPNLEYIIIDGGSTDNTVEIIKKYEKHLTYWISEKDKGQADAINKGLNYCSGEIFNWLNSDDYLEKNALFAIAREFDKNTHVIAGQVRLFDVNATIEFVNHKKLSSKGLMYWEKGVQFVQPGVWLRRELVAFCGGIDDSLHYCFDWDLYIRYMHLFSKIKFIDDLLIHFRYHDQSKTVTVQQKFNDEQNIIIEKLASQNKHLELKKLAVYKLNMIKWMPFLHTTINDSTKSKFQKIIFIFINMKGDFFSISKPALGALKRIIKGEKV